MTLKVKVTPRAARTGITGEMADGTLKIDIAAPPDKGKANEELRTFLARHYAVQRDRVEVISGATSTRKLVRIREE